MPWCVWLESELGTIRSPQRQTEPSVNKLGSRHSIWLGGLERREGRLPLSRGPRASLPALAGRGAASGVYHTPEGSPPGACLDQGLGSTQLVGEATGSSASVLPLWRPCKRGAGVFVYARR